MVKDSRRIAAILAADVVDYSRLTASDEAGALAALKIRRALFDALVAEFGGHEFGSVGDAVHATDNRGRGGVGERLQPCERRRLA